MRFAMLYLEHTSDMCNINGSQNGTYAKCVKITDNVPNYTHCIYLAYIHTIITTHKMKLMRQKIIHLKYVIGSTFIIKLNLFLINAI